MTVERDIPSILITLSDGRVQKRVLDGDVHVVGRDPSCDILLDDPSASRRHAILRLDGGEYWVEDLGSKNGTLVNDERVHRHRLSHRDEIVLGSVEIRYLAIPSASGNLASSVLIADSPETMAAPSYTSQSASLYLSEHRLKVLYDLSDRLTTIRDRQELLEDALTVCFDNFRFERGAIAVRRRDGRLVDWPVVRNLRGQSGELTVSQTILGRALNHGERAIVTDSAADRVDPTVSMIQHGIRSAMCVPLMLGGHGSSNSGGSNPETAGRTMAVPEILGVIYGDSISTGAVYTQEEVDFLAGIARLVTIGLINARLVDDQKRTLELEAELGVAREIQQQLFPKTLPKTDTLKFAALNEPGRTVSGDYYDVINLPDGRIVFLIADVTGEGVAAALLMSNLQAGVRLTVQDGVESMGALMTRWNSLIESNTDASKFITCLAGIVDPRKRTIDFAAAGHPQPFVLHEGVDVPTQLNIPPGFPLGVVASTEYETMTVEMGDNPSLLLTYTDGIYEAISADGEFFGEGGMIDVMSDLDELNPHTLIRKMRKSVSAFARDVAQSDDITMLALKMC